MMLFAPILIAQETQGIAELFIDGSRYGEVETFFDEANTVYLDSELVRRALEDLVKPELLDAVAGRKRLVSALDLSLIGIDLVYAEAELRIYVEIAKKTLIPKDLSARPKKRQPEGESQGPDPFSLILGMNGNAQPRWIMGDSSEKLALPLSAALNPTVSLFGFVAEAAWAFGWNPDFFSRLESARVLYDFPKAGIRLTGGLLNPEAGLYQSSPRIIGITAFRSRDLPGAAPKPSIFSEFQLEAPAEVNVSMNGIILRKMSLEPGSYRLSDIPLASGLNDVVIGIKETGGDMRTYRMGLPYDSMLLNDGDSAWHVAAGIDSEAPEYAFGSALGSYGLSRYLTIGANAQTGFGTFMGTGSLIWATPIGNWSLDGALSYDYGQEAPRPELAAKLSWRLLISRLGFFPEIGLGYEFRQMGFAPPSLAGLDTPNSDIPEAHTYSATLSQKLPWNSFLSMAAETNLGPSSLFESLTFSLGLFQPLPGNTFLSFNGGLAAKRDEPVRPELSISLSISPENKRNMNYGMDFMTQESRFDIALPFSDQKRGTMNLKGSGLLLPKEGSKTELNLTTRLYHDTYDLSLEGGWNIDRISGEEMVSMNFGASSTLVYSNRHLLLSKSISQALVLLAPDASLANNAVELRGIDGKIVASSEKGKFALGSVKAYDRLFLKAELPDSPPELTIRDPELTIRTGYKTITTVRPGSIRSYSARGRLVSGQTGIQGIAGTIYSLGGDEPSDDRKSLGDTFTDAEGLFYCYGLDAGNYMIVWQSGERMEFVIEDDPSRDSTEYIELGDIRIEDLPKGGQL